MRSILPCLLCLLTLSRCLMAGDSLRRGITLTGHAQDLEDGTLRGGNLVWASHRQGVLGSGAQIILPGTTLDIGKHEITLTAIDGDGQTGTARVVLFISGDVVQ